MDRGKKKMTAEEYENDRRQAKKGASRPPPDERLRLQPPTPVPYMNKGKRRMTVEEYEEDRQRSKKGASGPPPEERLHLQPPTPVPLHSAQYQTPPSSLPTSMPSITATPISLSIAEGVQIEAMAMEALDETMAMEALDEASMSITQYNKYSDVYLTMTANPHWPELMKLLERGEDSMDRHEIVARVFHLKRKALVKELCELGFFGRKVAHVYNTEFQKHGLPLMHALFYLKNNDKMVDKRKKHFCRGWCDQTTIAEGGYPTYTHRDTTMVLGRIDEIHQYIDERYIGPPEAIWHLLGFAMHADVPNVESKSRGRILFVEEGVEEASQTTVSSTL